MALYMAISDASSATVRLLVLFYLVVTDDTASSSARASVINKDKFNVPLSDNEHNDLFNVVKHLKAFIGLAESLKVKASGKRGGHDCHIMLFHHTEIQKAHYCNMRNLKITIERANLLLTFINFCRH